MMEEEIDEKEEADGDDEPEELEDIPRYDPIFDGIIIETEDDFDDKDEQHDTIEIVNIWDFW